MAQKYFPQRCVFDPNDHSNETKVIIAEDLERTLTQRGRLTEWLPYEIWSSNNARYWSEGLKKELAKLDLTYEPDNLNLVLSGAQWAGCITKYSIFMSKYLGLTRPADININLTPDVGFPFKATFRERIGLDRHVQLFLFETPDGRPMAQFMDGFRGVWDPPHIATVSIDPYKVELNISFSRSVGCVPIQESSRFLEDGFISAVIDGCRQATTTILGAYISFDEFRDTMAKAKITPCRQVRAPSYTPIFMTPISTSFPDEPIEIP